jgi:hypothetical protein
MTGDERDMTELILAKLDRLSSDSAAIAAKADAQRAESAQRHTETAARFTSLDGDVQVVRHEVTKLATRMTEAEADIRRLGEGTNEAKRFVSESDLKHEAELGGAIVHVQKLENAILRIDETALPALHENDAAQNRVQRAMCHELGLDYDAIASNTPTIPPPGSKPKRTALARIGAENKTTLAGVGAAIVLAVLQLALKLLEHH